MKTNAAYAVLLTGLVTAATYSATPPAKPMPPPDSPSAAAQVLISDVPAPLGKDPADGTIGGHLQLVRTSIGVQITGELKGLSPGSVHGFHVHATGDCSVAGFKSAGDHFNPTHAAHGAQDGAHHLGDLPNLTADDQGKAVINATIAGATLRDGGADDLVGKAVVLHALRDDYATQPSGNSGDRIACGVIK